MKEQLEKVMTILAERLEKYGFKREKTHECFVKMFDNQTIQTIGFNRTAHGQKFVTYLSPSPGIVYKDVLQLELKLRNLGKLKYSDYVGCMIGLPIGYLMPEDTFIEWKFKLNEDVTKEANLMVDAIIKYGIPYMEELCDRDNAVFGLEIGKYKGQKEYMLPIFYYLRGNTQRALECIDRYIKKFSVSELEDYEIEILQKLAEENGEVYSTENRDLKNYLEFVDNFKKMVEEDARKARGSDK